MVGQRHAADGTSAHRLLRWVLGQLLEVPPGLEEANRGTGNVMTALKAIWVQQWKLRKSTLPLPTPCWNRREEGPQRTV